MGKHSTTKLFLIFAAWTLFAVAAVWTVVLVLRFNSVRAQAEEDAALFASRNLAPTLERTAGDLDQAGLSSFDEAAGGLLGDQVQAIRLWSSDGRLLAATDDGQAVEADSQALARTAAGDVVVHKTSPPEGDVLVGYTRLGSGAVLEVQQDYGPIAESVDSSRRELLVLTVAGGAGLLLALPVILWIAIRGLKSEYDRLLYLYRTGQAVRSTLDVTDALAQLARDAALYTRAQLGVAVLVEERGKDLLVKASFDRRANTSAQHHRRVEEWYMRRCAGTGESVQAELASFPYVSVLGYEPKKQAPVCVLCVAIPGRERVMGVVMAIRGRAQGTFEGPKVQMVEEMAAQAAMAVEQARLFTKVRNHAQELELSYDSTLKVLVAALDTKDAVTHGHSERVAQLTVALAKEMDVPKERLVDIERGALLHDVGKIGVPDEVLHKPDVLDESEWAAMQKHPLLAGLMISKVEFLEGAMPILLYHHERFDGSGYPFGLEGAAIPLEARIFTVVDSYDAMTSDRPYRQAMPPEEALSEIQRNANIQFDPSVVEAFSRLMARQLSMAERAA
ncbi:MAG: hypothetical protein A2148_06370 [Chloroflexi bacterium RBG_16_68_14]|nr:MAG: hypothetical protein A2148_06370 [Chloroflexi bacterium RBG_16_68_14]